MRPLLRLCFAMCIAWYVPTTLKAQEPERTPERTAITIDYVGVEGIYLPVGADQGLVEGDTALAYASPLEPRPTLALVLVSVFRRRSLAVPIEPDLGLARGDLIYMTLPASPPSVVAQDENDPLAKPVSTLVLPIAGEDRPSGPSVSGRIALDLDGRESRTSWDGELFGETRRRYATSVARLSFNAMGLPGGVTMRGNLRAAHRYNERPLEGVPSLSVRAYELAATKRFENAPIELRMGRFYNPYESYSAFWDGLLVRAGGRRFGVGAAAGYEPSSSDEGFSTDRRKATGFADVSLRGDAWRYDGDLSAHLVRESSGVERTFLGFTQGLRIGRISLSQRLRADRPEGGSVGLGRLRLRATFDVSGPLTLEAGFDRRRSGLPGAAVLVLAPTREETSLGFSLRSGGSMVSVNGGLSTWGRDISETKGRSLTAAASQRFGSLSVRASGRHWARDELQSLSAGSGLAFDLGRLDVAVGYQLYRTRRASSTLVSHTGDLRIAMEILDGLNVTAQAQRQGGSHYGGTRLRFGLWRSF